jgi:hypothetical protein
MCLRDAVDGLGDVSCNNTLLLSVARTWYTVAMTLFTATADHGLRLRPFAVCVPPLSRSATSRSTCAS